MIKFISSLLSIILFLFTGLPSVITESKSERTKNIEAQKERVAQLSELYNSGIYTPVNESEVVGFDVEKAYADGVKFNEVAYIATHNSYQLQSVPSFQKIYRDLETVTFGLFNGDTPLYCSDTLTEQFNLGIRSIEMDIQTVVEGDSVNFVCSHSPLIDMTSSCYDFSLALEEIKMWSDANPRHLPITIIIEPKELFLLDEGMKFFNVDYANKLDELLLETFGEKLITPEEMMGDYSSLKEMRENDGWMKLEDCAGRVAVFLHDTDGVTSKYISQDETVKTQAMFPMLRYKDRDKSYACVLIVNNINDVEAHSQELIFEKNLIIRTLIDSYGNYDIEEKDIALEGCVQIVSTDYPIKKDMTNVDYCVSFDGKTAKIIK